VASVPDSVQWSAVSAVPVREKCECVGVGEGASEPRAKVMQVPMPGQCERGDTCQQGPLGSHIIGAVLSFKVTSVRGQIL
jgi:hypothetical protein